VHVLIVLCN